MTRRVLMVVPHRVRDLEGQALLAYHLQSTYGYEVELCGPDQLVSRLLDWAPDAVVLDDLGWNGRGDLVRLAKRLNVRVAVVPIAGLWESRDEELRAAGRDTGVAPLVDVYLSWGEAIRRTLLGEGLMTDAQVHAVGCPRFDLYSEPYLRLMQPRDAFLRRAGIVRPGGPVILWATNTPHFARGVEQEVRAKVENTNIPEHHARTELEEEAVQFREHSRLVLELARRHPDWHFIVKVHPLEPVEAYVEMTRQAPNLHVAFDAPIREFLYHCDVLLQRGCTTAAEAWMLNKPVLELAIGEYRRHWVPPGYAAGNEVVTSIDQAEAAILRFLAGDPLPESQAHAREAIASEFYFRSDGRAAERCAERIARVLGPPSYTEADRARTRTLVETERRRRHAADGARLPTRVKKLLGVAPGTSLRVWKRWLTSGRPSFTRADREIAPGMVEALFGSFRDVLGESR
jgi:surface carbohydrate biosynthesis protein